MSRFKLPFTFKAITNLFTRRSPTGGASADPRNKRLMFTVSAESVSLVFENRIYSIPSSSPAFEPLRAHLVSVPHDQPHDAALVEELVSKPKMLARVTEGLVSVEGSSVLYKGQPVHSTLATKLVQMVDAGEDATPWTMFLERVMANPSERSRACLFDFLNVWEAPVTEDGHFIAFKRVRNDFRDIHSGTMDNSPGTVVSMPRDRVNPDPTQTCSSGLHCCATSYLGDFYGGRSTQPVVAVKVDPADVVAVPNDYGFAKMRVCRYLVLGVADGELYNNAHKVPVAYVGTEPATGPVTDDYGRPICYNATDFADNWRRSGATVFAKGDTVIAKGDAANPELPGNPYMVGELVAVEFFDDDDVPEHLTDRDFRGLGQVASWEIEWQDGTTSDDVFVYPGSPSANEIEVVDFIGEEEDLEDDVDEEDLEDDVDEEDLEDDVDEEDLEDEHEPNLCPDCYEEMPDHLGLCEDCDDRRTQEEEDAEAEDEDEDEVDYEPSEMSFTRNGQTYLASAVQAGLDKHGQRGYSRLTGIPRTTLQEWVKRMS